MAGYATGVRRGIQQLVHANLTALFGKAPIVGRVAPRSGSLLDEPAR